MKHWNQTPPPDDDNMKSIWLDGLATVAARGGLEMEEKLKTLYGGWKRRTCSFLWSSDPDHQLFKQKIAEYTKSPPPLPSPTPPAPAAQNNQGIRLREKLALCSDPSAFSVGIPQGMMHKELGIIKFTAQFVVRYGYKFVDALWGRVSTETQFKFLDKRDRSDIRCHLFSELHLGYSLVIKAWKNHPAGMEAVLEGFFTAFNAFKKKQEDEEEDEVVDKVVTDRRDFLVSDEYFVDIENKELPPLGNGRFRVLPGPDTFRVGIPEGGMMRKELGIIKLTAQFVVRYGNEFWDALWDRVSTGTEFQFLKRNPGNDVRGRYTLFSQLLLAYGIVIQPWGLRPRKSDTARMEAVLQRVFAAFNAFKEKQEKEGEDELVDKVVTDRRDFVVSDEYFVDIEFTTPLPELTPAPQTTPQMGSQFALSPLMMQPSPMHAESSSRPPPPLHEEPEPKRVKLLVSEEEFLAQHPGSFTFTIWEVTTGRLFQITVQSLSENVANLKEKIAGETGIPANQQKLMGKSVFLKDDMSLAHYNLGVGEVLILA